MKTNKRLGVYMDHSNATLMEISMGKILSKSLHSDVIKKEEFDNEDTHEIQGREEKQLKLAYFKSISDIVRNYEEVILFGPTDAKNELLNKMKEMYRFDEININIQTTDKMTAAQKESFVLNYFVK
jgi:stalled ribosome rescue protein Dom34